MKVVAMTDVPLKVTIIVPCFEPRARGIHSTGRFGTSIPTRMHYEDVNLIDTAASLAGVDRSTFIRSVATQAAKLIIKGQDQ
jgi:hypothetical protein